MLTSPHQRFVNHGQTRGTLGLVNSGLGAACDPEGVLNERLDGGERSLAQGGEPLQLRDELSNGSRRTSDREHRQFFATSMLSLPLCPGLRVAPSCRTRT